MESWDDFDQNLNVFEIKSWTGAFNFLQVTNHTTNEYFLSKGEEKYWYAHGLDKYLMPCIWYCSAKKSDH